MTGASPVTTIYGQRPSQRRIVVAPLAGAMEKPGAMQKKQLARTSSVSDDGDAYAP